MHNHNLRFLISLLVLLIFHAVGLIGMVFYDQEYFSALTPLNLLLTLAIVFWNHRPATSWQGVVILFFASFLMGYLVELLGTQTGFPFGNYIYGKALGISVLNVPLIIGVNWFLMLIGSAFSMRLLTGSVFLRIVGGAALMTLVDLFIEPLAPVLDFWYWQEGSAPVVNYLGWFAVSILMQLMLNLTIRNDNNRIAVWSFVIMLSFFIALNLWL